ncbi:MAG TPA: hypothetical protein VK978_02865 [Candidatus Saccharimonadales bacterium]|nr:hypothetical protein [Candidatus Saccharimonadales bacterium]
MRYFRLIITVFIMTATLALSLYSSAQAASHGSSPGQTGQDKSALAISPAIVEHILKPGENKQFTLRVTNLTNFPLPISGTVKNFLPLEDIEEPSKRALYDASTWITIAEPDFILQSKQTRDVRVGISPPAGAGHGGHYATVYFQPLLPQGVLTPATAYLSARVGSLAFLIVPGALDEKIEIRSFGTPRLQQSGPVTFSLVNANKGNVHLSPNGRVSVRDWRGRTVATLPLKPGVILPGTRKNFTIDWNTPAAFGRYTAAAELTYGSDSQRVRSQEIGFWIIPWGLLLAIGLPLSFIAVIALRTRGRWKQAWRILTGKSEKS